MTSRTATLLGCTCIANYPLITVDRHVDVCPNGVAVFLVVHPWLHRPAHRHTARPPVRLEAGLPGGGLPLLPAAQLRGGAGPASACHPGQSAAVAPLRGLQAAPDPPRPGQQPDPLPAPRAGGLGRSRLPRASDHHVTATLPLAVGARQSCQVYVHTVLMMTEQFCRRVSCTCFAVVVRCDL